MRSVMAAGSGTLSFTLGLAGISAFHSASVSHMWSGWAW